MRVSFLLFCFGTHSWLLFGTNLWSAKKDAHIANAHVLDYEENELKVRLSPIDRGKI